MFAPFHTDTSCAYTETKDERPIFCCNNLPRVNPDINDGMGRVEELEHLYREVAKSGSGSTIQKALFGADHPDGHINMSQTYFAGHSTGGHTAYLVAKNKGPEKVKACLLFDALMNEKNMQGDQFRSDVPLVSVNGNYDADAYFVEMMDENRLGDLNHLRHTMHEKQTRPSEKYECDVMDHLDFTDKPFIDPYGVALN